MQEPSYDAPQGYRPIATFAGELLLTDRRLLFVETQPGPRDRPGAGGTAPRAGGAGPA